MLKIFSSAVKYSLLLFILLNTGMINAQLLINEYSQGASGNKEYIEFVVYGQGSCIDTCADLRSWIIDDNNGWYGTSAISPGCFRFKNDPNWACVPYGSIIVIYNHADINPLVPPNDPTDANNDGVYVLPINSPFLEMHNTLPSAANNTSYPTTGFTAATTWTNIALNNTADLIQTISPTNLNQSYHAVGYGGMSTPILINGTGSQKVYYLTNHQYNLSAGWAVGNVPTNETPGAPNTTANATWINSLGNGTGGTLFNDTINHSICQGDSFLFGSVQQNTTGFYSVTYVTPSGCDSIITLNLNVLPKPTPPTVTDTVTYCQFSVATPLSATGNNLKWYVNESSNTPLLQPPTPNTNITGATSFFVSQSIDGCESNRSKIVVIIKQLPDAPLADTIIKVCKGTPAFTLVAQGQNLQWYSVPTGGIPLSINPVINTNTGAEINWYVSQTIDGCESNRTKISITISEIVALFNMHKDSICLDEQILLSNASIGNDSMHIWQLGDGTISYDHDVVHQYSLSGVFNIKLWVVNKIGCSDSVTKSIYVGSPIDLLFVKDKQIACPGEIITFSGNLIFNFNQYEFDMGDNNYFVYNEASDTLLPTLTPYHYQFTHAYETDGVYYFNYSGKAPGCTLRERNDSIIIYPMPKVDLGSDTSICLYGAPILLANKFERLGNESYLWQNGDTALTIYAKHHGQFSLTVNNGFCSTTNTITIEKDCYTDIPNSFTPNNDGINDYFYPKQLLSKGVSKFEMTIWNRWGQVIFKTETPDGRGWDGKFNNTTQPLGVYIYSIKVGFKNGKQENYQGNVTLIR